jgi:dTDP-4-dehydrorhamnose reductase
MAVNHSQAELSGPGGFCRTVQKLKLDVIDNPAAYTAVDKAETDRVWHF